MPLPIHRSLFLLFFLALTPFAAARTRAVRISAPLQIPNADAIAASALARGVPGVVIGVKKGNAFYTKAWGDFDVEAHLPQHEATVHQIASLSKQFTSAAIMRLVEQGRLRLDDRASRYVVELDARFDSVTIERLLSHTAGLLEFDVSIGDLYTPKTEAQILAAVRPPFFTPGTRHFYSNMGYFLLGVVIERASGKTYEQFLRDELFLPLGLDDTSVCGSRGPVPVGYLRELGKPRAKVQPYDMSIFLGSGSLCSTVKDLLVWNHALANGLAVAPQSYAAMITPFEPTVVPAPYPYGFGLVVDTLDDRRRIWHNGALPGFVSHLAWFPDENLTIAVLVNLLDVTRDNAGEISVAIARAMK